jgi:hypothetical protein
MPQKIKLGLPNDPVLPLLRIYPKELKSTYNRDTHTTIFIAVLLTITRLWINIGAHQLVIRLNKCGIYTMEYYSTIKKNEIMSGNIAGK